jgi:hypothetical protein
MARALAGFAVVVWMACSPALAAPGVGPAVVSIGGAVVNPKSFSMTDLELLPSVTLSVTQQAMNGPGSHNYTGVLLWSLVSLAQFQNAPGKNTYLRHTMLVSAGGDSYAAAISEGEIDPKLGASQTILAFEKDGAMLAAPQLVVPGDAHAARAVQDVTSIVVQ